VAAIQWWDTNGAFALYGAVAGGVLVAVPLLLLERSHRRMELRFNRESRDHAARSTSYQALLLFLQTVLGFVNTNRAEVPVGARPNPPTQEDIARISSQIRTFGSSAMQKIVDSYLDVVTTYVEIDTTLQTLERTSYRDVFWRGAWEHWAARVEPTREELRQLTEEISARVQLELHGTVG